MKEIQVCFRLLGSVYLNRLLIFLFLFRLLRVSVGVVRHSTTPRNIVKLLDKYSQKRGVGLCTLAVSPDPNELPNLLS